MDNATCGRESGQDFSERPGLRVRSRHLTRRECWSHINAMVGRSVTVRVTAHFLDEAENRDCIAHVYRGQGSPDALKDR
jgi:hypothetical protein